MLKKILNFLFPPKKVEFDKFVFAENKCKTWYDLLMDQLDQHQKLAEEWKIEEALDLLMNTITPGMQRYLSSTRVITDFLIKT